MVPLRKHLEARVPHRSFQPRFQGGLRDVEALFSERGHSLDDEGGVDELVVADETCLKLLAAIFEALSRGGTPDETGDAAHPLHERVDDVRRGAILRACDRGVADDRRLLSRDLPQSVPEQRAMIQPYLGDDREGLFVHGIGGVPSAAKPRFQHSDIALLARERDERERGLLLECGGVEFPLSLCALLPCRYTFAPSPFLFCGIAHHGHILRHFVVGKGLAVQAEAFVVAQHGGGIVRPHAVARRDEHGSQHRRHRTFAVGARDVHDGIFTVG